MTDSEMFNELIRTVRFCSDEEIYDLFYVEYPTANGKKEFARLDSSGFRSYITTFSYDLTDGAKTLSVSSTVSKLQDMLMYYHDNYPSVHAHVRVAGDLRSGIEYDLQNSDHTSVQVTAEGWKVSGKKKKFLHTNIGTTQVEPVQTDKSPLELLKPYIHATEDMYTLFVIWLIQAFSQGAHFALLLLAEKGSGKSTTSRIIRDIIDPSRLRIAPMPKKIDDILVQLYNSSLCIWDNVTTISDECAELCCGAITGTVASKRSLFTNSELSILPLSNTIVINGIDVVPMKDDLAQRMLLLKLQSISSSDRKTDSEIRAQFKADLPLILGSIFETLKKAMVEIQKPVPKDKARLADAYVEMWAIAKALDIPEEKFFQIYEDNKKALQQIRGHYPVVEAVKEYLCKQKGRKVIKTSEQMYKDVYNSFSGDKSSFPNSASCFSKALEEHQAELRKEHVRFIIDDTGAQSSTITFIKTTAFRKTA